MIPRVAAAARRQQLSTATDVMRLHYLKCAKMFRYAPVNSSEQFASRVQLAHQQARVQMPPKAEYHHAANALHGMCYFKMLDDASFFAAQSINSTHFVVTTSFTTYITRPVVANADVQHLVAIGRVTSASRSLILAEAVMSLPDVRHLVASHQIEQG